MPPWVSMCFRDGSIGLSFTWVTSVSSATYASNATHCRLWSLSPLDYCEINYNTRKIRVCVGGTLTTLPIALPAWSANDVLAVTLNNIGAAAPSGSYTLNGGASVSLGTASVSLPPIVAEGVPFSLFTTSSQTQTLPGTVSGVSLS